MRARTLAVLPSLLCVSFLVLPTPATAQEAPPALAPPATAADPSFMFVQTAAGGTFTASGEGSTSSFRLVLEDVGPETVYFSDRPSRVAGALDNTRFLDAFPFTPANPPNAAIVLSTPASADQDVIIVELTAPLYDAERRTLSYAVEVLTAGGDGLEFLSERLDATLPARFDHVSVFIDDCPNTTATCWGSYQCSGGGEGEQCCRVNCGDLGEEVGTCWSWLPPGCFVCHDYSAQCSAAGGPCAGGNPFCLTDQCASDSGC